MAAKNGPHVFNWNTKEPGASGKPVTKAKQEFLDKLAL
jgi:hypothetical protein